MAQPKPGPRVSMPPQKSFKIEIKNHFKYTLRNNKIFDISNIKYLKSAKTISLLQITNKKI